MAKIVQFTNSLSQKGECALDAFVDDGDLLEFSRPEDVQIQADGARSILASDWTNQELADLYRAHSLVQSAQPGLECDRGISDEGDPWFLIGDDKGDVLVHICRIKETYILDSVALSKPLRGTNFNDLIHDFLTTIVEDQAQGANSTNEPTNVVRLTRGGTVCLHPSMMIAALVWTLLMNSNELTLPHSNGTGKKGMGEGQDQERDGNHHENQDNAKNTAGVDDGMLSNADWSNMSDPVSFETDTTAPINSDEFETDGSDLYGDLGAGALSTKIEERDEKQLVVSAYSNALTTLAIAIGFYASAESSNVFWKSALTVPDTSVTFDELEADETSDFKAPSDHLSDALAVLSPVLDLVIFENDGDVAAETRNAGDESEDALSPSTMEAVEVNIGQHMLTMASDVFTTLADASHIRVFEPSGAIIEATRGSEASNTLSKDVGAELSHASAKLEVKKTISDVSIEGITQAYEAADVNINRYDASSFTAGLEKFDDELAKYSHALEDSVVSDGERDPPSSETEAASSGASDFNKFDDNARSFINFKIANSDVEILAFANEIIFVDKAAFSGNNMSVSWQLEDGGLVSMVGLSSDMAEFLVA